MKIIEEYSYNGCRFAGGPWRTTIADRIDSTQAAAIAEQWRDTIRERAEGQFTPATGNRQIQSFLSDSYREMELLSYGDGNKQYSLLLVKDSAVKGLSFHPETAWSILTGDKTIDCRRAPTAYRGQVLICTSSTKQPILINRHAICVATLVDVVPFEKKHLKPAMMDTMPQFPHYAWKLDNILPIQPFPIKGSSGLFDVGNPEIRYMYVPQVDSMNITQFSLYAEKFYLAYYFPLVYTDNPNLDGFIAAIRISEALRKNTDLLFADDPLPPEVVSIIGDTFKRFINGNKPI